MSYYNCENITKKLLEKNHFEGNKALTDFISYSKKNFTRKKQEMKILENISELNNEGIILKDSGEHKEDKKDKNEKKEKKKTLIQSTRKIEEKENDLSLIQTDSLDDNMDINEKKNELEISVVGLEKLEKKKKNVSEIQSLIKKCTEDIANLDILVKKYKYSSKDLMMKSEIIDDKSMICISKKDFEETVDNDEDFDKNANYFNDIKNEFILLKKRLENLLSMYNSEKELTEIKKRELEKLELLNNKYNDLKRKQYEKRK